MMKLFFSKIFLLFALTLPFFAIGQVGKGHLLISGKISDPRHQHTYKTLRVAYNVYDWFMPAGGEVLKFDLDSTGCFDFLLPDLGKPYLISLVINGLADSRPAKLYSGQYFVESGDRIQVELQREAQSEFNYSARFRGIGAEKYNLAVELEALFYGNYYSELNQLKIEDTAFQEVRQVKGSLIQLAELTASYRARAEGILDSQALDQATKLLLLNEYAGYTYDWMFRALSIYNRFPQSLPAIAEVYEGVKKATPLLTNSISLLLFAIRSCLT